MDSLVNAYCSEIFELVVSRGRALPRSEKTDELGTPDHLPKLIIEGQHRGGAPETRAPEALEA
jgi:hypothetical protein